MNTEAITLKESSRLIELEKIVTTGLQSWIEVGEALIEIRDSRLYRIEARTFGEYIQNKFKMSHQHANRLMTGAPIAREIEPIGVIPESAVREIAKVAPEKRQEVFTRATETAAGSVPTAREIKQVVEMDNATIPPKSDKLPRLVIDCADELWITAKSFLDTITKDDASREKVLRQVIAYAENRLEKRK